MAILYSLSWYKELDKHVLNVLKQFYYSKLPPRPINWLETPFYYKTKQGHATVAEAVMACLWILALPARGRKTTQDHLLS